MVLGIVPDNFFTPFLEGNPLQIIFLAALAGMAMLIRFGYYYIVVWNKLYKRKLWETYRFREGKLHEDEFAFHHIIGQCHKISCISDIGYYYVQRTGSIMSL